ncbi:carbon-nitrogen hydrolase family protein [Ferrimonas senticii]|uniref:carbon-nitrogen hydrolase family protein n=1 Tax=Ferrimonas senticii TaxID=394566 RepID=UPI0004186E75|nr:carbon-nitrogen hydrolase family protein [Ferrimonas senticii]
MSDSINVHLLQMTSGGGAEHNLSRIRQFLAELAVEQGAALANALVVLPEACLHFGEGQRWHLSAEPSRTGHYQQQLAALAKQYQCYLVAGTLPVAAADGRAFASSWLFGPDGNGLGRYDKVHLFDAEVGDGHSYHESRDTHPGSRLLVIDSAIGRIGMAVCYDVRFPSMWSQLAAEVDLMVLPAAFTERTGAAHWQPLLQARAIENQIFVLAANQWGQHPDGRRTWGQSIVVDPWGTIIAERPNGEGWVSARLNRQQLKQCRQDMPVLQHRRAVAVERIQEES